jgi:hypothetical protein
MKVKRLLVASAIAVGSLGVTVGSAHAGGANNTDGPYDNDCQTSQTCAPSNNGNGNGKAKGRPAAGSVGNADGKNPPGQLPNATDDGNNGYECDGNSGVAKGNPAHSGCRVSDGDGED